jgi:anti-sigma regulatory factor (Ser/Thr protein kinase)
VGPARRAVTAYARRFGFSDEEIHEIATGVGEAIVYVAERAAKEGGFLEISYRGEGRFFEIEIQDSGFRFSGESTEEERSDLARGIGVQLLLATMDYVDISRNGMRIRMIKERAKPFSAGSRRSLHPVRAPRDS